MHGAAPLGPQRTQRNASEIGWVPLQEPQHTVTVCPTCELPVSDGLAVFCGGTPTGATTLLAADVAGVEPTLFLAVTVARSRWPTSEEVAL